MQRQDNYTVSDRLNGNTIVTRGDLRQEKRDWLEAQVKKKGRLEGE